MKSSRGEGWKAGAGQFDGRSGGQHNDGVSWQGVGSKGQGSGGKAHQQTRIGATPRAKTSYKTPSPQQSGGRGMRDCGNKPPGNESSSNNFPGTAFPYKSPGNKFFGSGSSVNQLPGTEHTGTGFLNKPPGIKFSTHGSSGIRSFMSRPPGNEDLPARDSDSIKDGKREALLLCKGRVGSNEQKGAALKSSKSEKPTFVFGGNLSSVPSSFESEKWTEMKTSVGQVRQAAHIKEIPDLAKALRTAVEETVSENFKVGSDATRQNLIVSNIGRGEERLKKLEQRVGYLEQKLGEEKAARERLLASVERALVGEETSSELNLVQLIQDIKAKIMRQGQKILSLDLNGNEAPPEGDAATKRCKSGSPIGKILHGEVGLKTRPVETSIIVKPHPGICHF